jgi:CRP-like cAMP-binding protein
MQKQLHYLNKTQFVSCLKSHQVSLFFDKIKDNVKDHYKTFEAGEHLFRENDDSSEGLFLIKEGEVKVSIDADASPILLVVF